MPVSSRSTGSYHPLTAGRPRSSDGGVGPPDPERGCGSDSRLRVPIAVRKMPCVRRGCWGPGASVPTLRAPTLAQLGPRRLHPDARDRRARSCAASNRGSSCRRIITAKMAHTAKMTRNLGDARRRPAPRGCWHATRTAVRRRALPALGSACTCLAQAGTANCIELHDQHRQNRRSLTAHPRHPWLNLNGSRVRFGRQPKPDQYKRTAAELPTKFHEGLR